MKQFVKQPFNFFLKFICHDWRKKRLDFQGWEMYDMNVVSRDYIKLSSRFQTDHKDASTSWQNCRKCQHQTKEIFIAWRHAEQRQYPQSEVKLMLWWPAKAAQVLNVATPPKHFTITALSKIKVKTLIATLLQKLAKIQWSSEASYTLFTQMTISVNLLFTSSSFSHFQRDSNSKTNC